MVETDAVGELGHRRRVRPCWCPLRMRCDRVAPHCVAVLTTIVCSPYSSPAAASSRQPAPDRRRSC